MIAASEIVIAGLDPAIHPVRNASFEDGWIRGSSPRMTTFVVMYVIARTWQINAQIKKPGGRHAVSHRNRRLAAETGMAGRAQRAVGAVEIARRRARTCQARCHHARGKAAGR